MDIARTYGKLANTSDALTTPQLGNVGKTSVSTTRGADKSLARPGRKQATATEDIDFYISYL